MSDTGPPSGPAAAARAPAGSLPDGVVRDGVVPDGVVRDGVVGSGLRILVVEDDPTVSEVVARYLVRDGFTVDVCADGAEALARVQADPFDLVVLDAMIPGLDGFEVCRRLREPTAGASGGGGSHPLHAHPGQSPPVPVIMLTARTEEADRVRGLELGADDYVLKPFSPRELVARVTAVLRRSAGVPLAGPNRIAAGDLEVDVGAQKVRRDGQLVVLAAREFELLVHLMRHSGQVLRREELFEAVWGYNYGDMSTITVHIRRLREKLEADPSRPAHIQTVWGVGYRFEP
ncbi:MAG: response regulator transcription factor [Acidimicrobiales bacterium]